jgi:hypothetical protein
MSGLFLSYSRADRALAERIVRQMRALGVDAWWDEDMGNEDWQLELERRIHELSGVLVIWTEHSVESKHVRDEARLARREDKLINVMAGITSPPFPFDAINGFNLDDWSGREPHRGWSRVVAAVEELVVDKGAAKAGEITVALALREQAVAARRKAVADAEAHIERSRLREAEAAAAKDDADRAADRAQEQLQRVAEMRASPALMRAAQQDWDAAFEAREDIAQALTKARRERERAGAAHAEAMDALEALIASPEPLTKATPAGPPAVMPASEPAVEKRPRRTSRKKSAAAEAEPAPAPTPATVEEPAPVVAMAPPPQLSLRRAAPAIPRRPLIAAGVGGLALAAVAGVVFLVVRPPAADATHAATPAAQASPSPAPALTGKWAVSGLSCADASTISVDGDRLTFVGSDHIPRTAIIVASEPGAPVETRGPDGDVTYTVQQSRLTMSGAQGSLQMTRCSG